MFGGKEMSNMTNGLQKNLKTRHISMISIAGVIGAGLFVGSGAVIHSAGPGSILSYSFAGLLVIFIMRMLGEMACAYPTSGSFSQYASDAIGPWAGFTIGWLYWFFWVIVIAIEAIAGAAIGAASGQGKGMAAAMESIGRNPNSADRLQTPMILGLAFIEALAIYAFVIAFLLQGKI